MPERKQKLAMPVFSRLALLILVLLASCSSREERRSAVVPTRAVTKAKKFDLVDVRETIPGIAVDLRYASRKNVARRPLYPPHMPCLLRRSTAARLKKAQELLSAQGFGLRVWDAYRPPEVQRILHQHGGSTGMFLSPKTGWSRHCAGICVDATLVDSLGNEVRMPTYFDEDLDHARPQYQGGDPAVQRHLSILQTAMKQAGFTPLTTEWWHFDDAEFLNNPQPIVYGWELAIAIQ